MIYGLSRRFGRFVSAAHDGLLETVSYSGKYNGEISDGSNEICYNMNEHIAERMRMRSAKRMARL